MAQLPHSYYFTTRILVLKFAIKGVFFEEIQDSHFPRKRGILVLTFLNLVKKGLILMSSVLPWKKGFIWAEKSVFYCKKGGSFWTEKSEFYHEKWVVLSWKVSVLSQKRGSFSNWRTGMGTTFSSEWVSRDHWLQNGVENKCYMHHVYNKTYDTCQKMTWHGVVKMKGLGWL